MPFYVSGLVFLRSLDKRCSVQFSHSVVSNSLRPHELQHARPPCPSPTPGVHSDSCPSSQWCHLAILIPFSSCPQSFPALESFPMSWLFAWGGQSTGVSALASFLPKKSQDWSPSEWTVHKNTQIISIQLNTFLQGGKFYFFLSFNHHPTQYMEYCQPLRSLPHDVSQKSPSPNIITILIFITIGLFCLALYKWNQGIFAFFV